MMKLDRVSVVFSLCLALAACGGGNSTVNETRAPTAGTPTTATPSTPATQPADATTPDSSDSSDSPDTPAAPDGSTAAIPYQALNARFNRPLAITADSSGNLYVAGDGTVRKITPCGEVSTIAGAPGQFGTVPTGGADGEGSAARFNVTSGITAGNDGNLYVADSFTNTGKIRKITLDRTVSTVYSGVFALGIAADGVGNIHFTDNFNLRVTSISPAGTISHSSRIGGGPRGIAADGLGNLYVTNTGQVFRPLGQTAFSCTIEKLSPAGLISTLAGSMAEGEFDNTCGHKDGQGQTAAIGSEAQGIVVDGAGTVYFTDTLNHTIRKVAPDGMVTTIAGLTESPGSSDGTGEAARFNEPKGITISSDGNLYVADTENHAIRRVTPDGVVTTAAGKTGEAGSIDVCKHACP